MNIAMAKVALAAVLDDRPNDAALALSVMNASDLDRLVTAAQVLKNAAAHALIDLERDGPR